MVQLVIRLDALTGNDWLDDLPMDRVRLFMQGWAGIMIGTFVIGAMISVPSMFLGIAMYMIMWRPILNLLSYHMRKDTVIEIARSRTRMRELDEDFARLTRDWE